MGEKREDSASVTRRTFVGAAGASLLAGGAAIAQAVPEVPNRAVGRPRPRDLPAEPLPDDRRLGFAVVGLGKLALSEIVDAFGVTRRARLAALVSGDRDKARRVGARYGVPEDALYGYEDFDRIAGDPRIDAVYIVLPNGLHREFAERAFRAGKHVLCEKPLATNVADCEAMIAAARTAGRKLMTAYRCQFEPHNLTAMRMLRRGELGEIKVVSADIGRAADPTDPSDQWRLDRELAGSGSLFDIGIYALNGARFLLNEEPVEVRAQLFAKPGDARFAEVEDVVAWQMRFPSGVLFNGSTSYSYAFSNSIQVIGTGGIMTFDPAIEYHAQRLRIRAGGQDRVIQWSPIDQFAREIDHFCASISDGIPVVADGEEGLQDVRLMLAILEAGRTGRAVATDWGYRRSADPATTVPDGQGVA
ncbi:Gfo/Idh/MocA family protein [Sphingosinicella terrae]|uniref:Gfo/Idh/MocA family protein n=1 Tax=Sphingosinicella terrae TaxID=2172047 RepID=UPI0013B3AFCB|nr:Gfo/Idh/MocA family oxidoreductase [Sphingosinicella terrae]